MHACARSQESWLGVAGRGPQQCVRNRSQHSRSAVPLSTAHPSQDARADDVSRHAHYPCRWPASSFCYAAIGPQVIQQKVEDVELPEGVKVDIIVSEWMG